MEAAITRCLQSLLVKPISSEDQPLTPNLLTLDQSEANEPTAQLVALLTPSGNERSRGFIVSDEWLKQAQALVSPHPETEAHEALRRRPRRIKSS